MNLMFRVCLLSLVVFLNVEASFSKFAREEDDLSLNEWVFSNSKNLLEAQKEKLSFSYQELVNTRVVKVAKENYAKINQNWVYIEAGEYPSTQSEYWKNIIINMQGTKCHGLMRSKKPGTYREALVDLISKPAKLECLTALVTVKLLATAEILGDNFENFVKYFTKYVAPKFQVKEEEIFAEMSLYCWKESDCLQVEAGGIHYFNNVPEYGQVKKGNVTGHNVICVGNNKYVVFYGGGKKGIVSKEKIFEEFREDFFNEDGVIFGKEKKHKELCEKYKDERKYYSICDDIQKNKKPFYFNVEKVKNFLK